jgi:hypothetical protein
LTVSASVAANSESREAGDDAECSPSRAVKLARCEPRSAMSNVGEES